MQRGRPAGLGRDFRRRRAKRRSKGSESEKVLHATRRSGRALKVELDRGTNEFVVACAVVCSRLISLNPCCCKNYNTICEVSCLLLRLYMIPSPNNSRLVKATKKTDMLFRKFCSNSYWKPTLSYPFFFRETPCCERQPFFE